MGFRKLLWKIGRIETATVYVQCCLSFFTLQIGSLCSKVNHETFSLELGMYYVFFPEQIFRQIGLVCHCYCNICMCVGRFSASELWLLLNFCSLDTPYKNIFQMSTTKLKWVIILTFNWFSSFEQFLLVFFYLIFRNPLIISFWFFFHLLKFTKIYKI